MARSTAPSVPPSLQPAYKSAVNTFHTTASTNYFTRASSPPPTGSRSKQNIPLSASADRDANILANQWIPKATHSDRLNFVAQRKQEILAGTFPSTYWDAIPLQINQVTKNIPTCPLCITCVGIPYRDPARRASRCKLSLTGGIYAPPAPHSGLPNPSAGWYGDVQSTQFQDRWWASRQFVFYHPPFAPHPTDMPLYFKLDTTQELYASFRGNQLWSALSITLGYSTLAPFFGIGKPGNHVTKRFAYRFPIAPPATPWTDTITQRIIISVNDYIGRESSKAKNNGLVSATISSFPANGRYFSRNNSCGCWLTAAAQPYLAKAPP